MVCLNFEEVCDTVIVEMGLLFSFEYRRQISHEQ